MTLALAILSSVFLCLLFYFELYVWADVDLTVQLHRLIDLKQQQASLAEAYYARESAKDTASQGRTVLIFTVVTIIFCETLVCSENFSPC